jgi:glycosyltransferase involved in cell wall biosynthesis
MYKNHRIAVVVSTFNDQKYITRVINDMPEFVDHIIVVDDCSTDKTAVAIQATRHPKLIMLQTPVQMGMGVATVMGFRNAQELKADVTVRMDGGGLMEPSYMYILLDAIIEQGYDYAKGRRVYTRASLPTESSFNAFLSKLATGYWRVSDPHNGFVAIRESALRALDLDLIYRGQHYQSDMLFNLRLGNFRVQDVPMPAPERVSEDGSSAAGTNAPKAGLLIKRFFQRLTWTYARTDYSPVPLFLVLGLILLVWGVGFGAYHWLTNMLAGTLAPMGIIMFAAVPLLMGFYLLVQAWVLDIHNSPS